jgi:ERCC4-type nuclease
VRDTWPRTSKVYCHPSEDWPADPAIIERVPVRSCVRRGAAIDLVLDRGRENRSQFVFARARDRQVVFWQSARTRRQARPNVSLPTARAAGVEVLEIIVDSHERYAWTFSHQQATTTRRALSAGDYAVEDDGHILAAVERKSLPDLVATITGGKLWYLLAALASVPHAAVVVEERYSQVFKLDRVRPAVVADAIAEAAVRYPAVPIRFCETRGLAQEWTYRFLAAALAEQQRTGGADHLADRLPSPRDSLPEPEVTTADVRAWARTNGLVVSDRGRLPAEIWSAYRDAHPAHDR